MDAFTPPKDNLEALKKIIGDDPCVDDDCGEILSPCCQKSIQMIYGSLPLLCICSECKKEYRLRDLIAD
jgi:hypothetical protein